MHRVVEIENPKLVQ